MSDKPVSDKLASGNPVSENAVSGLPTVIEAGEAVNDSNVVSRTVGEMTRLLDEIDDAREELMARGVQNQTINVLVEFGFHNREEGYEALFEPALTAAREAHGVSAITREELEERLANLVSLERDIAHARRLARQQGLDLQVLNFLTQIIRKNPGDGGEQAIDTFCGYALACGLPLSGIAGVAQRVGGEPKSVLPDIARRPPPGGRWNVQHLVRDAVFGVVAGVGIIWLMV